MSAKRILFVCTGNSCRSVMAQGLTQHLLRQAGVVGVEVESAGVFAMSGMAPTRETESVLRGLGIDCSNHRASQLTEERVRAADLILVMEQFHAEEVARRFPDVKEKVHLLKSYGRPPDEAGAGPNIPDPIGKPLEVYEVCFAEIREAIERLVKSFGVHT